MDLMQLPVAGILDYENNPRNNDHAVDKMAEAIEAHGFRVPVLVREGEEEDTWLLVDGHLRMKAARQLGLTSVPALDVSDMPEETLGAFRVSVNRMAELADWDLTKLVAELDAIEVAEDELPALTGMDEAYLHKLMGEPEVKPRTTTGESRNRSADPGRVQAETDTVNLSLSMTVAQRREVLERLDVLKTEHNVETRSEALLKAILPAKAPAKRTRKR